MYVKTDASSPGGGNIPQRPQREAIDDSASDKFFVAVRHIHSIDEQRNPHAARDSARQARR